MGRRPLRRHGTPLDARRGVRVHGEPRVVGSLRLPESRGDRARVHEQGVRGDRSGAASLALAWARRPGDEGLVRGIVRALLDIWPWIAIGARISRTGRGSSAILSASIREHRPARIFSREMARRIAGERRLVAARDAGNGAPSGLRALRSLRRDRRRVGGPDRSAGRPRAGGDRRRVLRRERVAVLALGLVGQRRRRTGPLRAGGDCRARRGVTAALA